MALVPKSIQPPWFSQQQRENWCWAACCSMALGIKPIAKTQCAIAQSYFSRDFCCPPGACDAPCQLADVVTVFKNNGLSGTKAIGQALKSGDLIAALARGPVAVGLRGNSGMHMILVYGSNWSTASPGGAGAPGNTDGALFKIADPAERSVAVVSYAELQTSNSWTWALAWTDLR